MSIIVKPKVKLVASPAKKEITVTRNFSFPRRKLFSTYMDRKSIPKWWGPKDFKTMVKKMDPRPGGIWRFIQRGPDGKEYAFTGVYHEIKPPKKIVMTFEFEGFRGHKVHETVTFFENKGRTRMVVTDLFDDLKDLNGMLESGMEEGINESFDRLEEVVKEN
jgi:uncharacterized protein YndB with AHSA1/START domain